METLNPTGAYIPALPTLWPSMLKGGDAAMAVHPFSSASARYFYFARNAVWTAVRMLGLAGGEVLVPAYHHGVEVEALIDAGAKVRFYRVGPRWQVDLDDVARLIGPKTRALYLIHYAGFPGPIAEMRRLADAHGLSLIEDCALSLFASDGATPLGTTGDASVFCLYKTLPVPHGGVLVTNGRRFALPEPAPAPTASTVSQLLGSILMNVEFRGGAAGRWVRSAARSLGRGAVQAGSVERVAVGTQHFDRRHVELGMSEFAKRIALGQDPRDIIEKRRRNFFFLLRRLREVAPPIFNQLPPGACPLFYPLVVEDKAEVMARLALRGIETVNFWRDFHPMCDPYLFPEVAALRRTVLEIPCHQDLDPEKVDQLATAVRDAVFQGQQMPARANG